MRKALALPRFFASNDIFHTNSRQTIREGRRKNDLFVEYINGGNYYESNDAKERKDRAERVGQFFKNNAGSIATI